MINWILILVKPFFNFCKCSEGLLGQLLNSWIQTKNTYLNFSPPTPQNGQTHLNNFWVCELFVCVWPFYGVSAQRSFLSNFPFSLFLKALLLYIKQPTNNNKCATQKISWYKEKLLKVTWSYFVCKIRYT